MNLRMTLHTARAACGQGDRCLLEPIAQPGPGPAPARCSEPQHRLRPRGPEPPEQSAAYRAVGVVLVVEQRVPQGLPHVRVTGRLLEVGCRELGEAVLGQVIPVVLGLVQRGDGVQVHLGQLLSLCFQVLGTRRGGTSISLPLRAVLSEAAS